MVATAILGGIGVIIKAWRAPKDEDPKALPPGQKAVTHADLEAIEARLVAMVRAAEEACEDQTTELRSSADKNTRDVVERIHQLALKVERLLASHEERHGQRSQRGGRR